MCFIGFEITNHNMNQSNQRKRKRKERKEKRNLILGGRELYTVEMYSQLHTV